MVMLYTQGSFDKVVKNMIPFTCLYMTRHYTQKAVAPNFQEASYVVKQAHRLCKGECSLTLSLSEFHQIIIRRLEVPYA